MKQLTIRGIDEELHQTLKRRAAKEGLSVNRYVVRLLYLSTGHVEQPLAQTRFHDLDHLAGTWDQSTAAAFTKFLDEQRQVDEELWS